MTSTPDGMKEFRMGDLLKIRKEEIDPADYPDKEFVTLTLSQEGVITPREAGIGNNPPSWHGVYFTSGSKWFVVHSDDFLISRIDLWKGCAAVVSPEFDNAIVTQEFPVFRVEENIVDPHYLALLLRSDYFLRATRAITTGHSNRRRTPLDDLEKLRVFLPDKSVQKDIADIAYRKLEKVESASREYAELMSRLEKVLLGQARYEDLIDSLESQR